MTLFQEHFINFVNYDYVQRVRWSFLRNKPYLLGNCIVCIAGFILCFVLVREQQTHISQCTHKQALSFCDFPNVCAQASHYHLGQLPLWCVSTLFNDMLAFLSSSAPSLLYPDRVEGGDDQMGSDVKAPQYTEWSMLPAMSHDRKETKPQLRAATVSLIILK